MLDILPFPQITATEPKEQISQVIDYLFRFKEELEFLLSNVNEDNLSQDLIEKLNSIGADIEKNTNESTEQLLQLTSQALTVSDIVNSTAFKMAVQSTVQSNIPTFSINFETGQLEYR